MHDFISAVTVAGRPVRGAVLAKRIDAGIQEALAPQRHLAAVKVSLDSDVWDSPISRTHS